MVAKISSQFEMLKIIIKNCNLLDEQVFQKLMHKKILATEGRF